MHRQAARGGRFTRLPRRDGGPVALARMVGGPRPAASAVGPARGALDQEAQANPIMRRGRDRFGQLGRPAVGRVVRVTGMGERLVIVLFLGYHGGV